MKNKKTKRVVYRKGFWWTALFGIVVGTMIFPYVLFYCIGWVFIALADLLRELLYLIGFKEKK